MLFTLDIIALKPREKIYKAYDKKGLFLIIHPSGGKYWRFKYRFNGKEKSLSFGIFPEVSLEEARKVRDDARKKIKDGSDPAIIRKLQKLQNAKNNIELEEKIKKLQDEIVSLKGQKL